MSDLIDPTPPPEPPEVEVSQASERDSALAAVLRHQTEKEEVEAHARDIRVRRQGLGLRHIALSLAVATATWIWIWPPGVLRIDTPRPPAMWQEESALRLVMCQNQPISRLRKLSSTESIPGACPSLSMTQVPFFEGWNTSGSRIGTTAYSGEPGA